MLSRTGLGSLIVFLQSFSSTPRVLATVRMSESMDESYVVSAFNVTVHGASFNVCRLVVIVHWYCSSVSNCCLLYKELMDLTGHSNCALIGLLFKRMRHFRIMLFMAQELCLEGQETRPSKAV